jgi:signal transduction histidine kinase
VLREVELFAGLDDGQLAWLAGVGTEVDLVDGEVLFTDGEIGENFYVLLSGELLITKEVGGREEVFSRHSAQPPYEVINGGQDDKPHAAHQFTGELPLLVGGPYVATAVSAGNTRVLAYDRETFYEMLARCPQVCRVLIPVLAWRIRSYERLAGRRTMLQGLDKLVAGLAHELNNPSAAMLGAAHEIDDAVRTLARWSMAWGELATDAERAFLLTVEIDGKSPSDALAAAEAADEVHDWLAAHDLCDDALPVTVLADVGVEPALLDRLTVEVRPVALRAAIGCVSYTRYVSTLVADVTAAGRRIEALVRSAAAYSNLDRAPQQSLDVVAGLEATLDVQAAKLRHVRIHRAYTPVPPVLGYPGELNQVWTNLIDNAVDAMEGRGDLWLRARVEADFVVVEIRDNGVGVPVDVLPWLFHPFFTTKDIGKGSGLGLHYSHDVVTRRHHGSIALASVPGDTLVTVRLPAQH